MRKALGKAVMADFTKQFALFGFQNGVSFIFFESLSNHTCHFVAMLNRGKKKDNVMTQYYIVIGAFVGVCVLAVLYVLLNPKKSFS